MKKRNKKKKGLDWKDYIALIIALFTTTLLPVIRFLLVLLAILLILFIK